MSNLLPLPRVSQKYLSSVLFSRGLYFRFGNPIPAPVPLWKLKFFPSPAIPIFTLQANFVPIFFPSLHFFSYSTSAFPSSFLFLPFSLFFAFFRQTKPFQLFQLFLRINKKMHQVFRRWPKSLVRKLNVTGGGGGQYAEQCSQCSPG